MKNEVKLRFMGYELPCNPKSFSLKKDSNILQFNSPLCGSVIQNLGTKPFVFTGEGVFFGADSKKQYDKLFDILKKGESGLLYIPMQKLFYAYLTSLSVSKTSGPDVIHYKFQFIEDCQKAKGGRT